jgi:hypothetical protein
LSGVFVRFHAPLQLVNNLKEIRDMVICGLIGSVFVYTCFSAVVIWPIWGMGYTLGYLVKHFIHICCGFAIIFQSTRFRIIIFVPYQNVTSRRMDSIGYYHD